MPATEFLTTEIKGGLAAAATISSRTEWFAQDGFDLAWRQQRLRNTMASIESEIEAIESNANLSDTERMFAMQMAMNTWSAVSNLRTNMLKSVSDTLKAVVRNVN